MLEGWLKVNAVLEPPPEDGTLPVPDQPIQA
jgi:hypothetical protein